MLYRLDTPFGKVDDYMSDYMPATNPDGRTTSVLKPERAAEREQAAAEKIGRLKAFSTWMALQSLPVEVRASLGVDLTDAPQLDNSTVIPLPDMNILYTDTSMGPRKHEEKGYKQEGQKVLVEDLKDITGLDYHAGGGLFPQDFKKLLAEGDPDKATLIVGDFMDKISGGRSLPYKTLLIQNIELLKEGGWKQVLSDGQAYNSTAGNPRVMSAAKQFEHQQVQPTQNIDTIASPKADAAFIEFYNNPTLIDALKAHQQEMMTFDKFKATAPSLS